MKAEFIAATVAKQEYTGGPVEICAMLNRLPRGFLNGPDDQMIDEVDALMDDLCRQGELVCPGHRWLRGPPPISIRDGLVRLHARGNVHRDAATGEWRWVDLTWYFSIVGGPMGPGVGVLFLARCGCECRRSTTRLRIPEALASRSRRT